MKLLVSALALTLTLLSGCISSSNPNPPARTTVVVPPNSPAKTTVVVPPNSSTTVVCQDGSRPPCN